ncbi:unnamed protein product [Urochloa humidicola]
MGLKGRASERESSLIFKIQKQHPVLPVRATGSHGGDHAGGDPGSCLGVQVQHGSGDEEARKGRGGGGGGGLRRRHPAAVLGGRSPEARILGRRWPYEPAREAGGGRAPATTAPCARRGGVPLSGRDAAWLPVAVVAAGLSWPGSGRTGPILERRKMTARRRCRSDHGGGAS